MPPQTPKPHIKPFSKRIRWIIASIAALALLLVGFLIYKGYIERPADLGPRLQYIGKQDFGCFSFPLAFICLNDKYSVYHFATDMTEEEIKTYFKGATYSPPDTHGTSAHWEFNWLHFKPKGNQDEIVVTYYSNPDAVIEGKHLKKPTSRTLLVFQTSTTSSPSPRSS